MESLRDRLESVQVHENEVVSRYVFRFTHHAWAIFYVDHKIGGLTISSDWGHWAHFWVGGVSLWGTPIFMDFLKDCDCHYLSFKLIGDGVKRVPSQKLTFDGMEKEIHNRRQNGRYDRDKLRTLWRDTTEFCDAVESGVELAVAFYATDSLRDEFESLHEWVQYETAPSVMFLYEELLPTFLGYLRGHITLGENRNEKHEH